MNVLVACEFSGIVREAFKAQGHNAWSCDLLPTEIPGNHIQDNVLKHLKGNWDLMIAHPPCTYLAISGARWFKDRMKEQETSLQFVNKLLNAPIKKIALENPVGVISTKIRKPDQMIEPYMFGHSETKLTCLWLKNLPYLETTNLVPLYPDTKNRIWHMAPGEHRSKERSRTYKGIAEAMAIQWGQLKS